MIKNFLHSLHKSIGFNIIVIFFALSTISTIIFTFLDYNRQLSEKSESLSRRLDQIEKIHIKTLSNALWKVDQLQTQLILNSMLNLEDVIKVSVYSEGEKIYDFGIDDKSKDNITKKFPIEIVWNDKIEKLGTLEVIATQEYSKSLLRKEMKFYIISEFVKVMIFVLLAIIFVKLIIIRHLDTITDYFKGKEFYGNSERLKLNRDFEVWKVKDDNFDLLVSSINKMVQKLELELEARLETEKQLLEFNNDLEKKVTEKTRELLDTHRMGAVAEMSSGVMHEINSPLSVIYGVSKRLSKLELQENISAIDIEKLRVMLSTATTRIFTITGALDVLSYTADPKEKEKVEIDELIETSMNRISELYEPIFSALEYSINVEILNMKVNKHLFSQLLFLLVHIKSKQLKLKQNGKLTVSFEDDSTDLIIRFIDNAPEMTHEEKKSLKDPFYGTLVKASGSLLMWGSVSGIVNKLNGQIFLDESKNVDELIVKIPLVEE